MDAGNKRRFIFATHFLASFLNHRYARQKSKLKSYFDVILLTFWRHNENINFRVPKLLKFVPNEIQSPCVPVRIMFNIKKHTSDYSMSVKY